MRYFLGRVNRDDGKAKHVTLTDRSCGLRFEATCQSDVINAEADDEFEVSMSEDGSYVKIDKLEPKTLSTSEIENISKEVNAALGD